MRQEEIRQRLNKYIQNEGITAKHICNQLGMSQPLLSKFRKNRINLYPEQITMIEIYLDRKDPCEILN